MSKIHQQRISKYFPNRAILYQPGLGLVLGSVKAGLLLSQLLYWHEKGGRSDGWIYKTMKEIKAETGLTRTEQMTAIKICRLHNFFDYKRAGIPAKRHFRINMDVIEKSLPSMKKKVGIVYPNPPPQFAENMQSNTESTHETTTENTKEIINSSTQQLGSLIEARRRRL